MGNVTGSVKWVLRTEGLVLLILALLLYVKLEFSWLIFAIYFLVPDLSFLGYIFNKKIGAISYNCAHTLIGALFVLGVGFFAELEVFKVAGLIWVAHVGFDRALGYGLKYQQGFGFTHLGLIGKEKNA